MSLAEVAPDTTHKVSDAVKVSRMNTIGGERTAVGLIFDIEEKPEQSGYTWKVELVDKSETIDVHRVARFRRASLD